jgi:coenzyme F420-0:L-glutamate ligase
MQVKSIKTKVFKEKEDIFSFVTRYIRRVPERSVIVITSKIVALAEGRTRVVKNAKEKEAVIREESEFAIKTEHVWLTLKDGALIANAGVDESNVDGEDKIILLPKDSYAAAEKLRKQLMKHYGVQELGVLLTDSRILPFRAGVVGVALGYAGFRGVHDYRGTPDIFGRKLKMTRTDIADALATSAVLLMGEGRECQPLALITGAPLVFVNKVKRDELYIDPKEDMYAPFFTRKIGKK